MARCPVCAEVVPVGSNCLVDDTSCFTIDGAGTELSPHTINPVLDGAGTQLLTCGADGLLAVVPTTISNKPAALAYRSSHQSIANNTLTAVTLNIELYDTDTMHSIVTNTNRLTFTTAGVYLVTVNCAWNKNTTGDRTCRIRKGGADILTFESKDAGGSDLIQGHCLTLVDTFTATEYVECLVQQTSGAALLLLSEGYSPIMAATRIA